MSCEVPGCARPVSALGLCAMHYQRQRRGTPLDAPPRSSGNATIATLTEAALAYAHAESEQEHGAALQRLVNAAERVQRLKPVGRRRCGVCHAVKSLEAFHRDRNRARGRSYVCAACDNARSAGRARRARVAA